MGFLLRAYPGSPILCLRLRASTPCLAHVAYTTIAPGTSPIVLVLACKKKSSLLLVASEKGIHRHLPKSLSRAMHQELRPIQARSQRYLHLFRTVVLCALHSNPSSTLFITAAVRNVEFATSKVIELHVASLNYRKKI